MSHSILRLPAVKERTGLSRSTIYVFVSRGEFPAPISLGARAVGWVSGSIETWIANRVEQSRATKKAEDPSSTIRGDVDMWHRQH